MIFGEALLKKRNINVTDRKVLIINPRMGIAYQSDRSESIPYDNDYFENFLKRADTPIGIKLNEERCKLAESECDGDILDIGIGCGTFIDRVKNKCYGYDIMKKSVDWLKERNLFLDINDGIPENIRGITMWDSLEHMPEPKDFLVRIPKNIPLIVTIPIIKNIIRVKWWKHYKPNEHFWYFTKEGFINFMATVGFAFKDALDFEIKTGREDAYTFVFIKT